MTRSWFARLLSWLSLILQTKCAIGMRRPTVPLANCAPHSASKNCGRKHGKTHTRCGEARGLCDLPRIAVESARTFPPGARCVHFAPFAGGRGVPCLDHQLTCLGDGPTYCSRLRSLQSLQHLVAARAGSDTPCSRTGTSCSCGCSPGTRVRCRRSWGSGGCSRAVSRTSRISGRSDG